MHVAYPGGLVEMKSGCGKIIGYAWLSPLLGIVVLNIVMSEGKPSLVLVHMTSSCGVKETVVSRLDCSGRACENQGKILARSGSAL